MLPRRHFSTASANTTTDIVRTRDAFNTRIIDSNDVAGAAAVKTVIDMQTAFEDRISLLEANTSGSSIDIGTYDEFNAAFNTAEA